MVLNLLYFRLIYLNFKKANVKAVFLFNDFLNKDSEILKLKAQRSALGEYEQKINDLINFSMKLLNIYNSYQMKDINYTEFKQKIFEKNIEKPPSEDVKIFIDNIFRTMDCYKKNKLKYLESMASNDEFYLFKSTDNNFLYKIIRNLIENIITAISFVLSSQEKPLVKILALKVTIKFLVINL